MEAIQSFLLFVSENSSWLFPTAIFISVAFLLFTGLIKKLWTIIVFAAIFGALVFCTRPEFLENLKTNISSGMEDVIDPLKDNDYSGILDNR